MKKRINKPLKYSLLGLKYFFIIFVCTIFVLISVAYYKLHKEPVDLGFLLPKVESYLSPSKNLHLSAESIVLSARASRMGLFHVQIDNLELKDAQNKEILKLPNVKFSYGLMQLFSLSFVPKNIFLSNAYLYVTLNKNNQFILEDKPLEEALVKKEVEKDLASVNPILVQDQRIIINDAIKSLSTLSKLRKFTLKNSTVVLNDLKEGKLFEFPNLNLTLKRHRFYKYEISSFGQMIVDKKKPMTLIVDAYLNVPAKTITFQSNFNDLRLNEMGRAIDIFNGFKVSLSGTVEGEISFEKKDSSFKEMVQKLSFNVETNGKGSIYLPHPLDIVYPIKKIRAQGVFGNQLEQLFIRPVDVELSSGLSADVDIVINGIGSFLNSNDLNEITTTINARLNNIPTDQISVVWPSYLGPDAHAWVKENLKNGSLTTALFTLYFKGSEISDLIGDVSFSGVDVHYLKPLPPVEKAAGKVMLYPDRVEIFATSGKMNNVQLEVGNVYLTDLLDDVSNSKIELKVSGPVQEMLSLIDQKPLDLIRSFGILPNQVSGMATGEVFLNFPLTDSLKPSDIKVDVKANLKDGTISLEQMPVKLEQSDFSLVVDNEKLSLNGKAYSLGVPLQIKWDEFFAPTLKNPLQSKYEVKGLVNDQVLKPYYNDISTFIQGPFYLDGVIQKDMNGIYRFDLNGDLKTAKVIFNPLTYLKNEGEPGQLNTTFSIDSNGWLSKILFDYQADKQTKLKGNVFLKGRGFSLNIEQAQLPDSDFKGNVEYYEKEFFKLNLSGSKLNISGLKEFPLLKNAEPNPNPELKMTPLGGNNLAEIYLDVNLDSLTLNKDMPLKQVALKAYRNGSLWQNLFLFAMAREPVSVNYTPKDGRLDALTTDVGDLLNRLGFSDQFEKGSAEVKGKVLPNGGFAGDLKLKDIKLKKPGFVMQAVTILGIWDAIQGNDLSFSNGEAAFELSPNFTLFIKDGVTYGTALGITFSGRAALSSLALSGSVIPAYIINSLPGRIPVIGHLFKDAKGGGLMGVKYEVTGTPANPIVSFKPLSSIAPGILGRFF